jgi:hypothetical protein
MKVINILKDGTICEDMSKITVPNDIVQTVIEISNQERETNEKED